MIGRIPVGQCSRLAWYSRPMAQTLHNQRDAQPGSMPATCPGEGGSGSTTPQGLLTVVDAARAANDPAGAVLAKVPGGCDPVRVTLSKDGARAFVTARGVDSLLIFDTAKLVADSDHALISTVIAGKSPVGVAVAGQNRRNRQFQSFRAGRPKRRMAVGD